VQQVVEDKFAVVCSIRSRVDRSLFNSVQVQFNSFSGTTFTQCCWVLQHFKQMLQACPKEFLVASP
jgi:hypothetical protein